MLAPADDAMAEVKRAVAEFGMIEIPPFDHPSIIAGQGTIAFELNEQLNDIDYIFSGLSGGGLLGGIGLAMKHLCSTNPYRRREPGAGRGDVGKPEGGQTGDG